MMDHGGSDVGMHGCHGSWWARSELALTSRNHIDLVRFALYKIR